jgi:hypothetical protein
VKGLALSCALALALAASAPAFADTQRFALIVAHHDGGPGLPRLRYAARDGGRLADVLTELGGFSRADILSVIDGDAGTILDTLDEVERRIADAKRGGTEVVFLFYYSGHAANGALRLGKTVLDMSAIRKKLEASSADVRLAFIDSCGAGAMTREKGGSLAPPFVVAVDEGLSARGQVIITSSSADEVSQESDDIQGSFFTHYLASGLRGDADRNSDGRVTLDEAYGYAYGRTVAATAVTRAGAQHPTYAYDLRGAGDVTLTEPGGAPVVLDFPPVLEGRYFVVDLERQLFVAEVEKNAGARSRIALPTGQYAIKKRLDSHLLMQRLSAREKGVFTVDEKTMERVSFQNDYAKGTPILTAEVERALGFSLSLGLGAQTVLDSVENGGLFPSLGFVSIEARVRNLLRSQVLGSLDLGLGAVQGNRLVDGGPLGTVAFPVQVTQLSGGASLLWEERLFDEAVLLAGGGRMAGFFFHHRFLGEAPVAQQTYLTFSPGLVGIAGFAFAGWGHVELMARAHWLPYNVDEVRHLALLDAVVSVWVDL